MVVWPEPHGSLTDLVTTRHQSVWGTDPDGVAAAPATSCLIGEWTDFTGGYAAFALHSLESAVSFSFRADRKVRVHFTQATQAGAGEPIRNVDHSWEATLDELEEAAAGILDPPAKGHLADSDEPQRHSVSGTLPTDNWAVRLGGVVISMIHRQMLTRDTPGLDITVACEIPPHAGLGRVAATTTALALALNGEPDERDDAPTRAKLAAVCHLAAEVFAGSIHPRGRFITALRGTGEGVNVIDFADGSLTVAPGLVNTPGYELAVVASTLEASPHRSEASDRLLRQREFICAALSNFGVTTLQQLPGAAARIGDWLSAVISVKGPEGYPRVDEATQWVTFLHDEADRARYFVQLLRARKVDEACDVFALSAGPSLQYAQATAPAIAVPEVPARPAEAGLSEALLTVVDPFDVPELPTPDTLLIRLSPGQRAH